MDDATFQRELQNIKQRAASCGQPNLQAQARPKDTFSDDLAALKMRLQSMEASSNFLNASQGQRETQPIQPMTAQSAWSLPSLPSSLPSGPLFWQLFTSLRTDVRGLDARVADVEQSLSNLEDRVDSLDPNRFTPPDSNATYASVPWASSRNTAAFDQPAADLPCDYRYQNYSPAWHPRHVSLPEYNFPSTLQQHGSTESEARGGAAAGIAFRDREIARLEDIISRMQADLQESEELMNHRNRQLDQMSFEQGTLRNQLHQMVQTYHDIITMNRKEVESQQSKCRITSTQLAAAERQIADLQRALSRAAGISRTESEEALAEKEGELSTMREFAEQKNDVIRQQGSVISRGATIIKERDDTIERLSKELKISIDECRNESRERERTSRLLEEKTEEIAQLKQSTTKNDLNTSGAELANSKITCDTSPGPITPLAFDAEHVQHQMSGQWTPQALGQYVKLPHEQRRAAAWQTSPAPVNRGRFGQAGQISLPRSDSLKLLDKLASVEEGHRTPSPMIWTGQTWKPRRNLALDDFRSPRLSLNDIASACETPSDLRQRLSSARDDDSDGHTWPVSKHHHVPPGNPTRRSLQAYVEAEDSRDKRGDAA